jgi:hypothetical protein
MLCVTSCNERIIDIAGVDCPYPDSDLEEVAIRFIDEIPDALPVLDRTDVFCIDAPHFYSYDRKVAGITLWPGSNVVRARIKVASDKKVYPTVESGATAHEFMHLYLWDTRGDPCDHSMECGWDESTIEEVNLFTNEGR